MKITTVDPGPESPIAHANINVHERRPWQNIKVSPLQKKGEEGVSSLEIKYVKW